jgi:diguanylate cyclase (GGDEF)-like protein/PAS domain S-box-containing protein
MSLSQHLQDPLIKNLLADEQRCVALLCNLSGRVEMLASSRAWRDAMGASIQIEKIGEIYSAALLSDLSLAARQQCGWAASGWAQGAAHWTHMELWPHQGMSLLFLRPSEPVRTPTSATAQLLFHTLQDNKDRQVKPPDLVVTTSLNGNILETSAALPHLFQSSKARIVTAPFEQWVAAQDLGLFKSLLNRCASTEDRLEGEFRLRHPKGGLLNYHWTAVKSSGNVCWLGSAQGSSLATTLVKTEERLHLILDNIEDGFLSLDGDWNMSYINFNAAQTFGKNTELLLGKNIWTELPELARSKFRSQLYRAVSTQLTHSFEWFKDGAWLLARCFPGKEGVSVFLSDITGIKASEEKARHQALHDSLTGLPNRECARLELDNAIAEARKLDKKVAVLFMDLDGFKKVNDTRGHETGDELLKLVAQRLQGTVRASDLVARQSGDEFLLILPNILDAETALRLGEKVVSNIGLDPFIIHAEKVHVGASVGIALYPEHGTDPTSLMKNADMAMYQVKQRSKNAVALFEESMADGAHRKAMLEALIRETLDRKTLQVHYQPRFCAQTGEVVALEALARMRDSQGRLISPADFIGVAEETRLIGPISMDVMEKAGHFIRDFNERNHCALRISVNISVKHLIASNLVEHISDTLQRCNLPAHYLEIEVPESLFAQYSKNMKQQFNALHALGVGIVIDNIGTGLMNLTTLLETHAHTVKFDRSLVKKLTEDTDEPAVLEALHQAYSTMGMLTVAEGVETEFQKKKLREWGFKQFQGYALAIPMMDRDITQFLTQHALSGAATEHRQT